MNKPKPSIERGPQSTKEEYFRDSVRKVFNKLGRAQLRKFLTRIYKTIEGRHART